MTQFLKCVIFVLAMVIPAAAASDDFILETSSGASPTGTLARITEHGSVELDGPAAIPKHQVIALHRPGMPPRFPHQRPHVLLTSGDRIPAQLLSIERERVRIAAECGEVVEMTYPLSAVAAIWMTARSAQWAAEPDGRKQLANSRRHDAVRLTNGDLLTGTIVAVAKESPLRLDAGSATVEIQRDRIDGLLFNSELARTPKPVGAHYRLVLRNGARLFLKSVVADAQTLSATNFLGDTYKVPISEVWSLTTLGGAAQYLSDLKPLRYEPRPYLGVTWPMALNRSVAGNDLRLGGGVYDKGLGLHSACKVTYAIPVSATRFEVVAGLDDITGAHGSVTVNVQADGRDLLVSAVLKGSGRPHELRLPVAGRKELTIEIGFGSGGDVQDHVNLADARFIVE
jgi:hypothetical protein